MTILGLLNKFETLDTDVVITQAMQATEQDLAEANRDQLFNGFDRDGKRLNRYRSDVYARKKNSRNPLPGYGNPDLRNTGAFYQGIRVTVNGNTVEVGSSDDKEEQLQVKYGNIFGLGGPFKDGYLDQNLGPAIRQKITAATGLKFG